MKTIAFFNSLKITKKIVLLTYLFTSILYGQDVNYYAKGKDSFYAGNYTISIKQFLKANKSKEKDIDYLIAMSYFNLKKYNKAITYFKKEIIINTKNFNAYIKKAESEKYLGKYKNALNDINKILNIDSTYFIAYFEKGNLNYEQKKYSAAIIDYNKALTIRKNLELAHYKIGFCYLNLKDTIQACNTWKKITELDDFEDYKKIETICNTH